MTQPTEPTGLAPEVLERLRAASMVRPMPSQQGPPWEQSRRDYIRHLHRLGADDALIARLTGPRRPHVPWWRPWARWRR